MRLNRPYQPWSFEHGVSYLRIATIALSLHFFLAGCGGGGSTSTQPPPPPPPSEDFSLIVPQSITLQQGGAPQVMSITAILSGVVTSTLTVSFPNLPEGVRVWPNQPATFSANQGTPQNYFLSASPSAKTGQLTFNISGTLGSVSHSYSFPVTVTAAAPFQLSLSPAKLSLTPGVAQSVQVTVVSNSGPVPDVSLATTTLPLRWDFSNPVVTGTEPGPFTLTFNATIGSQPLSNFPIFVTATSNAGDTYTVELPVSLTVPFPPITAPTRSTIVRTDDIPTGVAYDKSRKLIFAALPNLNEVRVFSSTTASLLATIPTIHPTSIDESMDGSKVYAGSLGLITTIDPSTLQVIHSNSLPIPTGSGATLPVQVITLSTGNVMVLSGTQLSLWNPATSATTPLNPQNLSIVSMNRNATGTKVLLLGTSAQESSGGVIYDAPSGLFGSTVQGVTGFSLGGNAAAINPNGSQIAIITPGVSDEGGFLYVYDGGLNLIASQPLYNIDSGGRLIYSLDGSTLYAFYPQPDVGNIGVAYDALTLAPEGLFSMANQYGTTATMAYAIDETGMIFGPDTGNALPVGALAFTDASHPGAMIPDQSIEPSGSPATKGCSGFSSTGGGPFPPAPGLNFPNVLCTATPVSTALGGAGFDSKVQYGVFVGPPPASPAVESATDVFVYSFVELDFSLPATPPNNTPGPVNLTLTRPDGWYQVIPEAFSYGPTALFADPLGIPPAGQTTINIFGYFLEAPTVKIGGAPATVISSGPYSNNTDGIFPLQQVQVTAPAAMAGPADITVTTAMGTTTLTGLQYLNSAQVYPIAGTLGSITYDQPRQRLYISNTSNNRVEIFNLATQALLSPISVGNAPTNLSLTPDGTRLAVLNSTDGTVSVIDPAQMKALATYPGYTTQDKTNCAGATPLGLSAATMEPHLELIAFECPFVVHVLNLDTGVISCNGIAGCDSTGSILNAGLSALNPQAAVAALASSADGTKALMTSGLSAVALLNLTQNTLKASVGVQSQGANAAINGDGNFFAANLAIYDSQLVPVNLGSGVGYFDVSLQGELGGGEAFNPSGSLLFIPSSGVDVFDVHQGRLALRIALPEQPAVTKASSLAVDETGTKVFILTRSGVTIAQIAVVPLSIASVSPSSGASGATVTIRGSGFQSGATFQFATSSATVTFVDSMTLTATVPNLPSGPVRVTVTNPGGQQYSFDAAYTVN